MFYLQEKHIFNPNWLKNSKRKPIRIKNVFFIPIRHQFNRMKQKNWKIGKQFLVIFGLPQGTPNPPKPLKPTQASQGQAQAFQLPAKTSHGLFWASTRARLGLLRPWDAGARPQEAQARPWEAWARPSRPNRPSRPSRTLGSPKQTLGGPSWNSKCLSLALRGLSQALGSLSKTLRGLR